MLFIPKESFEFFDEDQYFEKMATVESELEKIINSGYFKAFDGNEIYYEYYLVKDSKASIVIVQGYTEFAKKYHELCYYFLNSGYNVFIYDHRGHGFSCRETENICVNHINDFNDYVVDLKQYIDEIVQPCSKDVPMYIYSHSMGGAVSALYLAEDDGKIKKAILSSPMINPVSKPLPRKVLRVIMRNEGRKYGWKTKFRFSSEFNPDAKFEKSKYDSSKSRFVYNLNMRKAEPRYQNSMSSNRWNYEVLGVVDRVFKKCKKNSINAQVYIISALDDRVVKIGPQKRLAKRLGCKFCGIENANHSMCTSLKKDYERYFKLLVDFFDC